MNAISKKIPLFLAVAGLWILGCGFDNLEVETSAGIESVMADLTGEDFETLKIQDEWEGKVLAKVEDYVTVRQEPSADSTAVGRMFKGDGGEVLARTDTGWTLIHSGNVEGYVSDEYLHFGADAYEESKNAATLTATSLTGGLRIRSEASADSKILKNVEEGAKLEVLEDGDEWVMVQYAEEKTGYVSAEYVDMNYELGEAMTMDEIKKKEAEEKKEKLKQQLSALQANGDEVTLLAALIQAEAGNQPYEGQVAVGAVVMNRVRSGRYGSIMAVIYAPGQFGVVSNGSIGRYLSNPKASCRQAAQEAINGYTNIGGYTHFKNAASGERERIPS